MRLSVRRITVSLLPFAQSSYSLNCPLSNTEFLDQKIDHFGKHQGTFKQQYQVIDEFYKPGGPILFYQGAENGEMVCLVS